MTQLELALDAGISARHLGFVETGRSKPGREMLLQVLEQLKVPFREQNRLLLAAGHAPAYPERSLEDPDLAPVREALDVILSGHEPYPTVAVDRVWNMVAANSTMFALTEAVDIDPELLEPPINVMRVGLHPRGLGPLFSNLGDWHAHWLKQREMRPKGVDDVIDRDRGRSLGHVQAFEARARRQFADGVAPTIGESVALLPSRCLGEEEACPTPVAQQPPDLMAGDAGSGQMHAHLDFGKPERAVEECLCHAGSPCFSETDRPAPVGPVCQREECEPTVDQRRARRPWGRDCRRPGAAGPGTARRVIAPTASSSGAWRWKVLMSTRQPRSISLGRRLRRPRSANTWRTTG